MTTNLVLLSLGLTSSVHGQYWAKFDFEFLVQNREIRVVSLAEQPLRCSVAALGDKIWLELGALAVSDAIPVTPNVKYHQLSLFCKPMKRLTKYKPWRINMYSSGSAHTRHRVFFQKVN